MDHALFLLVVRIHITDLLNEKQTAPKI
jgi:hypothetical protein